jgi:hypothetical protein
MSQNVSEQNNGFNSDFNPKIPIPNNPRQKKNPKNDSKIPTKREKKFRQTFEKME